MIIEIQRAGAHVGAMGHRVALTEGGEPELRRRCYETLSRYDFPPAEVSFVPAAAAGSTASTLVPPASVSANEGRAAETAAEKLPSPAEKKASGPGVASIRPPTLAKAKERKGR